MAPLPRQFLQTAFSLANGALDIPSAKLFGALIEERFTEAIVAHRHVIHLRLEGIDAPPCTRE
jgi:hypothetical protein